MHALGPLAQDKAPSWAAGDGEPSSYRFLDPPDPDQEMVTYDSCQPIHYVVQPGKAPQEVVELTHEAVAQVEEATELDFVYDGTTAEAPGGERELVQPDRYGDRWAPVLIAWSDPKEHPVLKGSPVGEAGNWPDPDQGEGRTTFYVTGEAILDTPEVVRFLDDFGGRAYIRSVVMHELAHVIGLDHVDDTTQLMYESYTGKTSFGAGDLAGLRKLGPGPCAA